MTCKWLITMVSKSPQVGLFPFQMGVTNYLLTGMILQAAQSRCDPCPDRAKPLLRGLVESRAFWYALRRHGTNDQPVGGRETITGDFPGTQEVRSWKLT